MYYVFLSNNVFMYISICIMYMHFLNYLGFYDQGIEGGDAGHSCVRMLLPPTPED